MSSVTSSSKTTVRQAHIIVAHIISFHFCWHPVAHIISKHLTVVHHGLLKNDLNVQATSNIEHPNHILYYCPSGIRNKSTFVYSFRIKLWFQVNLPSVLTLLLQNLLVRKAVQSEATMSPLEHSMLLQVRVTMEVSASDFTCLE